MKKAILPVVVTLAVLALLAQLGFLQIFGINKASVKTNKENTTSDKANTSEDIDKVTEDGVSYRVKAEGDYFYIYNNDTWTQNFWKGVNIGSGEPGLFPGELNISYEDYYRWFEYISEMNANCIRVYTAMMPDFYNAFYDYNKQAENPIYLFHGVWVDEDDIEALNDVYAENSKILNQVKDDAIDMVNIIHGNCTLPARSGYASGTYTADISPWFGGWILGMEFDPKFIQNTNKVNPSKDTYDGKYLYTQAATPFEAFLAEVGDSVIAEETDKYKWQSPVAFSNWVTTDPLTHKEEPYEDEDLLTLNTESIKSRPAFHSNQFASYHVYPYYPDTMSYQEEYINYKDDTGEINTYEAYLADLKLAHTMPIMIAEFGVATSRGTTHESLMGWNQGGMEETDAGNAVVSMFNAIFKEKYAGGICFAWQDEWFKRTWNNEKFDDNERRPFWNNVQTSEQHFGLMSFDAGEEDTCLIDGEDKDWKDSDVVATNDYGKLSMKVDEGYVYFKINTNSDFDFDKDTIDIPIDSIANQGNKFIKATNTKLTESADFVLQIKGEKESRLLCDAYYDVFYYLYGYQYKMVKNYDAYSTINSGIFNNMMLCTGYDFTIPTTKQEVKFASYETGLLTYGISDPNSKKFNSLADFYQKDGVIEVRIPWQLLNFMDPSTGEIMADFYTQQSITETNFEGFKVGFAVLDGSNNQTIDMSNEYNYKQWKNNPTSHERLKKSYYILQKALATLGG